MAIKDRLEEILRKQKTWNVLYSRYNPAADLLYDVDDGDEDFSWMIYEIQRLREENVQLKEFIDYLRSQMKSDLGEIE
jgi:hypothetical protein